MFPFEKFDAHGVFITNKMMILRGSIRGEFLEQSSSDYQMGLINALYYICTI